MHVPVGANAKVKLKLINEITEIKNNENIQTQIGARSFRNSRAIRVQTYNKKINISMFQLVQMPILCIRKDSNECLPNHAPFQRICCAHNNLIDNAIVSCRKIQLVHANLPIQSHLRHPNLVVHQKPQFHPIPMHRVQSILACQLRFVPSIAPSWPIDGFCHCMDSETMNRQVPCHIFQTHTLAHILVVLSASNPFSTQGMPLNIWLAYWSSSNCSFHHRSYAAHILSDARSSHICLCRSCHSRLQTPMMIQCMQLPTWTIKTYLIALVYLFVLRICAIDCRRVGKEMEVKLLLLMF